MVVPSGAIAGFTTPAGVISCDTGDDHVPPDGVAVMVNAGILVQKGCTKGITGVTGWLTDTAMVRESGHSSGKGVEVVL